MKQKQDEKEYSVRGKGAEEFARLGTNVITNKEVYERKAAYLKLCSKLTEKYPEKATPLGAMEHMETQFTDAISILTSEAVPYLTAGDNDQARRLTFNLRRLSGRVEADFSTWKTMLAEPKTAQHTNLLSKKLIHLNGHNKTKIQEALEETQADKEVTMTMKWDTVHKAERFLHVGVFSRLLAIGDMCWKVSDLTKREIIVIHQNLVQGRGGMGVDPNKLTEGREDGAN